MAHFAKINENNIVTEVLVVSNSEEHRGQEFLANDLGLGGTWIKASYNTVAGVHSLGGTPLRKNFPGPGYLYDPIRDAFIPPKPFDSWILDEQSCQWVAPTSKPQDEKFYNWDEATLSWVLDPNFN